tara:strand:+ start:2167 stop:2307 length:141 start_codon:yes stop_codon:yes gene_type:complete
MDTSTSDKGYGKLPRKKKKKLKKLSDQLGTPVAKQSTHKAPPSVVG